MYISGGWGGWMLLDSSRCGSRVSDLCRGVRGSVESCFLPVFSLASCCGGGRVERIAWFGGWAWDSEAGLSVGFPWESGFFGN